MVIFGFNTKRNGSYLDRAGGEVISEGTAGQGFHRTVKGLAWKGIIDDNSYLNLEKTFDLQQDWTLSFQAKVKKFDNANWDTFVSLSDNTGILSAGLSYMGNRFAWRDTDGNTSGRSTNPDIQEGVWSHVMLTYDASAKTLQSYLNNSTNGSDVVTANLKEITYIWIGRAETSRNFNGYIASVKLEDHVYTPAERAESYRDFLNASPGGNKTHKTYGSWNKPSVLNEDGLVAAYGMVPVSGALVDISGNDGNGTLSGIPMTTMEGLKFDGVDDKAQLFIPLALAQSVKTVAFRIKPDTNTEKILEGQAGDHFIFASAGTLTHPDYSNAYVNGKNTDSIKGGEWSNVVVTNSVAVSNDTATLGINGVSYGRFGIEDLRFYSRQFSLEDAIAYHNRYARKVKIFEDFRSSPAGVFPRRWRKKSSSADYPVAEGEITFKQQVTDGIFSNASNWEVGDPWSIGSYAASWDGTANGDIEQPPGSCRIIPGENYVINFDIDNCAGQAHVGVFAYGTYETYIPVNFYLNGHHSAEFTAPELAGGVKIRGYLAEGSAFELKNFSIQPRDGEYSKYLLSNSSNKAIGIPSEHARGTWYITFYNDDDYTKAIRIPFISDSVNTHAYAIGYSFCPGSITGIYRSTGTGGSVIMSSRADYLSDKTWYQAKITRDYDGWFALQIRGGCFGENFISVDASGGGSNPAMNNNYHTSNYFCVSNDEDTRVTDIKILPHIIVKGGYCDEYQTIHNAFTAKPNDDLALQWNNMVSGLVDDGVWDKMDVFYNFAAHLNTNAEAQVNWKNPGTHDATLVHAPAFTALEGFTGDGANDYIETNFTPSADGVNYQLNDASHGAYVRYFDQSDINLFVYGVYSTTGDGGTDNAIRLYCGSPTIDQSGFDINNNVTALTFVVTDGMYIASRNDNAGYDWYINKSGTAEINNSTKAPDQGIVILARRTVDGSVGCFSSSQVSCFFAGAGLTQADVNNITDRYEAVMDYNGKGIIS